MLATVLSTAHGGNFPMFTDVSRQTYPFSLPELPYAYEALEPHIDATTMRLHHDKHHQTYVTKLNEALAKETGLHSKTLADLLRGVDKLPAEIRTAVRNNGGGHLLHDIFWNGLAPAESAGGARAPGGALAAAISASFGSLEDFRKKFSDASAKHFASGWVTLAHDPKSRKLEIVNLKDHDTVLPRNQAHLLILDVWEHAYYVKYQNRRPEFIEAFWNVVDWPSVERRFAERRGGK
jgi:Fe-Mn family superoxide dismutase